MTLLRVSLVGRDVPSPVARPNAKQRLMRHCPRFGRHQRRTVDQHYDVDAADARTRNLRRTVLHPRSMGDHPCHGSIISAPLA